MNRRLAMALVLPLVLSGCAGVGTRETVHVTSTQWVDPDTGEVVENAEPMAAGGDSSALAGGGVSEVAVSEVAVSGAQDGQVEFTGTVARYTGAELAPSGQMPNGEDPSSVYFVLDLDSPRMVYGRTAPGYKTEEVKRFKLGKNEIGASGHASQDGLEWEQYVGKRVKILVDEGDVNFPTDTSMPLGVPGFGSSMAYTVLD